MATSGEGTPAALNLLEKPGLAAVESVLSGYGPGFELVSGARDDAVERFAVLPARRLPRLLLPTSPVAMSAALHSFGGGRRGIGLGSLLIRTALKVGGPLAGVSAELSLISESGKPSPVRELMSTVLGRNDFHLAFRLSSARPNAKTVALAISHDGEALCFAKLGSEAMTNDLVAHESKILNQLADSDMPVLMPQRLYSDMWAGCRHVLITESLKLEPLTPDADEAHRAADAFVTANPVTTSTLADSQYWRDLVEDTRKLSDSGTKAEALQQSVASLEAVWGDLEFDFGASHGDWSRANLGLVDGRVAALDWERFSERAPRGIDTAHFAILEPSSRTTGGALDIERVAERARRYLAAAGRPPAQAEPLIMLDCLVMVTRFLTAHAAGLPSADSRFEPALQEGLRKWTA